MEWKENPAHFFVSELRAVFPVSFALQEHQQVAFPKVGGGLAWRPLQLLCRSDRDNTHLIQVFPVISSRNLFIADTKAGNAAHHLAWWMIFLSSAANQWGVSQTGGRKVSILVQFSGEVPNKYNWKIPVTCIAAPAEQWSCWPEKGCYPDEDHSHCHTAVADTVSCNEMV